MPTINLFDAREVTNEHRPARPQRRLVVGVDLGKASDFTAVNVLEHRVQPLDEWKAVRQGVLVQQTREQLIVRQLTRLPLQTAYPSQVAYVHGLMNRLPEGTEKPALVLDATGVGAAVSDMFQGGPTPPISVTITAGDSVTRVSARRYRVAKLQLISTLEAALHGGDLKIAAGATEAQALREELRDFQRHVTDAGHATFAARVGQHDDLVLSVALSVWWARSRGKPAQTFQLPGF